MQKVFKEEIIAILPSYIKDKGNCTVVWIKNKEPVIIEKTIKTTIKNMCRYYHLDLKSSNKTYGEILSIKRSPPIPFGRDKVFIKVKTRIPLARDDGAYGYINLSAIEKISSIKENKRTLVCLKNQQFLEVYGKIETINKNIKNGEIVRRLLREKDTIGVKESPDFYLEESIPATKKDIAIIYMKLVELTEKLL